MNTPGIFVLAGAIAAASLAGADGRDYFPPPESAGGGRWLEKPGDIRQSGGMDPLKLDELVQATWH